MIIILCVVTACALLAWIPCTLVVIHKDRRKQPRRLDEKLDRLNRRYARGELGAKDHSKEIDRILAEDWEKL